MHNCTSWCMFTAIELLFLFPVCAMRLGLKLMWNRLLDWLAGKALGNTCFVNSVLHCILHTQIFRNGDKEPGSRQDTHEFLVWVFQCLDYKFFTKSDVGVHSKCMDLRYSIWKRAKNASLAKGVHSQIQMCHLTESKNSIQRMQFMTIVYWSRYVGLHR